MDEFLKDLNEVQRQAVTYNEGPSMIIAGAGSGKTRVLTYKIAYLLQCGMPPYSILALTFTNKAAKEMKERISKVVGSENAKRIGMGTFHSVFSKILRKHAAAIGFKSDFTIYDSADSKSLIKTIIKEMSLDDKLYKPAYVQAQISNAKNHLVTPGMYAANKEIQQADMQSKRPHIHEIYKRYWNRCFQAGAMDFDDLLLYTNILFRDHPGVLLHYQQAFRFIMVDEYQDTNIAQHLIVELLSKLSNRVCVVGDDAQSIYSFRGANIQNILNFKNTIPGTRIFKLEQNYRSTQTIVSAADSLIKKNKDQIAKNIFSENESGEKIRVLNAYSDFEEAYIVANRILEIRRELHCSYSDFAILYRTNSQSRTLEEALRKTGVPYRIYGGLSFYQRKEIKDVISYFRMAVNPNDEEALKRIINYPTRGIGDTTLSKIGEASLNFGVGYFSVLSDPIQYGLKINSGTAKKLSAFKELIDSLSQAASELPVNEFADLVLRSTGIIRSLEEEKTVESQTRIDNIMELNNGIVQFVKDRIEEGSEEYSLTDFLQNVSLSTDADEKDDENADKITMMTVHASKGLEFPHVFIVGLEDNLFPSSMSKDTPSGVEEERRLMYVAITRAEKSCTITYAASRFRNGESQHCIVSPFIKDIDPRYLILPVRTDMEQRTGEVSQEFASRNSFYSERKKDYPSRQTTSSMAERSDKKVSVVNYPNKKLTKIDSSSSCAAPVTSVGGITIGDNISHSRFGKGVVTALEGTGSDAKATINFDNVGTKQLLLKFAKFEVIK